MFGGRSSSALALRPTFPSIRKNPLTSFFPLHTVHSLLTTFQVNTYTKHRGVACPRRAALEPYISVFSAQNPDTAPLFSAGYALRTEKGWGGGGTNHRTNSRSQNGTRRVLYVALGKSTGLKTRHYDEEQALT